VAAHYSGAPMVDGSGPEPDNSVLRIDLSEEHGVRVTPRHIF
jgi:hypothetical protein